MQIAALKATVDRFHLLRHPFYQRWNEGTLDRETLKKYARAYFPHVAAFPRYVSAVHSRCEVTEVRAALLENLIEEERGEDNHPELWLRFCDALGLGRDETTDEEPPPASRELTTAFFDVTSRSWQEGLAALYTYESMVPEIAKTKMEGLARFYGIAEARSVSFFAAHLEADVVHRNVETELLEKHVTESWEPAVTAAAEKAGKALWSFLDSMLPETRCAA